MSATGKFGVLVVDDHPIMRLGIVAIINAQPDMMVCAEAGSGGDAVRMFRQHRPDVTLMDLRLPGMSGLEALRVIRREDPAAHCVVLTTYEGDEAFNYPQLLPRRPDALRCRMNLQGAKTKMGGIVSGGSPTSRHSCHERGGGGSRQGTGGLPVL